MVLKRKIEHFLVRYGLHFLTRNTKKGTVRKTVDTKFGQKLSLKNGRVRYGTVMVRSSEKFGNPTV